MSTDLNMEYQEVKFGEIANHISKRVEPSETTLEVYVGLEHLDPDSLKITRHGVPSDVAGQKLLVKKGQIIFGKRRAYQRKVAVADWDCICSAHAMVLEAIPGKILPEFLPFFMQSNQFMERAVEISEGSLSPTIKWKILEQQNFKIPKPEYQTQILNILKSNLVNQKLNFESLEAIESLKNAFLNQVLIEASQFEAKPLSTLIDIKNGYAYPGDNFTNDETSKIIVTPGNFNLSGGYNADKNRFYKGEVVKDFILNPGDMIINMTDLSKACDTLGLPAFIPDSDKVYLHNQRVGLVVFKEKKLDPYYLFLFYGSKKIHQQIVGTSTGTTVHHTSAKKLLDFNISLPPIEIQKTYKKQFLGLLNIEVCLRNNQIFYKNIVNKLW